VGGTLNLKERKTLNMGKKLFINFQREGDRKKKKKKKEMVVRCGKRNILLTSLVLINYKK
jgi:hypothetical protein